MRAHAEVKRCAVAPLPDSSQETKVPSFLFSTSQHFIENAFQPLEYLEVKFSEDGRGNKDASGDCTAALLT